LRDRIGLGGLILCTWTCIFSSNIENYEDEPRHEADAI
jgi:hypothetical protein